MTVASPKPRSDILDVSAGKPPSCRNLLVSRLNLPTEVVLCSQLILAEADTIRILVATDNHVGFEERDAIRKDDSWRTFDEVMNVARTEDVRLFFFTLAYLAIYLQCQVDMVLLGGDLFHDNKPSRKSLYQVMRTLRKNCLGMKPCPLEFLSDGDL